MDKKELEAELEKRLTSRGLLRYAWDYHKAFEALLKSNPKEMDLFQVKYFLLCRTIELAMKAFLREKGYSRKQLMNIGHDLEKLILVMNKDFDVLIDVKNVERAFSLNEYYKTKQFEYPVVGYKTFPKVEDMRDITSLILKMVTNSIEKRFP